MSIDTKKYEKQLRKRLAYLKHHMEEIEDQLEDEPNRDWEEFAQEMEEDEVLEGLGKMDQAEARTIMAALDRIKLGNYGECMTCGDEISTERLDVLPHTPFCKEHAPG